MSDENELVGGDEASTLLQILHTLPDAAYLCDANGLITYYNRSAVEVWGRRPRLRHEADRFCGSFRLFHANGSPMSHDACWMAMALRDNRPYRGHEVTIERPDGSRRWLLAHATPLRDERGRVRGGANVLIDITNHKMLQNQIDYDAMHDVLTGLPNRRAFLRDLERRLTGDLASSTFSVLLLELNRFKQINDIFGHEYGDEILRQVRLRLESCVQGHVLVARVGGDEYAVVLPQTGLTGAANVLDTITQTLRRPIVCLDRVFTVDASLGMAVYPDDGTTVTTLLDHADLDLNAQRHAKANQFLPQMLLSWTSAQQVLLTSRLRQAIETSELVLHYQPKLDLKTRQVTGVEALVRWRHPGLGLLSPARFLPLAERAGLMRMIDLWVARAALSQARQWRREGLLLNVAVNFAPESLQDEAVLDAVMTLLQDSPELQPQLTIEITERAVVADPRIARANLLRLRALGVRVALDDFGTGYSSLAHLRELPVDELKIDQTFVEHLAEGRQDACIVRSVIALGHDLGLSVVVEGIENESVLNLLSEWGCDQIQGYYVSEPISSADLVEWLHKPRPSQESSGCVVDAGPPETAPIGLFTDRPHIRPTPRLMHRAREALTTSSASWTIGS